MKGALIFTWALLIVLFLSVFVITTVFVYRYRITIEVNYQYNYNNVQLALLTFLSSTHENSQMSDVLAKQISMNQPIDEGMIKDKLDKIVENRCYTLNTSGIPFEGNNVNCEKKYSATYKLPYPYNPQNITGDAVLVIG